MNTIGVSLLVAFVIVCVLLVLLVLVQDDGQNGMGGLLGGRGTAAFGSHSASVLTKATIVLVVLFFVLAVFLALINKKEKPAEDLAPVTAVESVSEEAPASDAETSVWWDSAESGEASN